MGDEKTARMARVGRETAIAIKPKTIVSWDFRDLHRQIRLSASFRRSPGARVRVRYSADGEYFGSDAGG
jgi:hypothetical protein